MMVFIIMMIIFRYIYVLGSSIILFRLIFMHFISLMCVIFDNIDHFMEGFKNHNIMHSIDKEQLLFLLIDLF
jgi:hypothetical protein